MTSSLSQAPRAPILKSGMNAPLMSFDVGVALFEAQIAAESAVTLNMQQLNPTSAVVLFGAGLVTSLSPCALSMVPLAMGLVGGLPSTSQTNKLIPPTFFVLGLACALSALGASAATLGMMYGQLGVASSVLPLIVSLLTLCMGLNLLKVLPFELPSFDIRADGLELPINLQAFVLGASSALLSSPCVSPVLASILGFVATTQEPLLGGAFLFIYTLGFTAPVLLASLATGSLSGAQANLRWVPPASGSVLVAIGVYSCLANTLGPA
mmetsp:Transcript_70783/g.117581  ORF Transcript_70783/g.117581 Transcript_70783/m.117581 type:complete len:267 (+) Transcript_70783:1-801(+)|eukprot:CAMPEP_0119314012 /NCGR_PEP_ID=MMETSP1333-20130426/31273_1 /TAXON_ID=418940 /ORGANISM="Scyphosphaera apsteinii, Strain RCC1455" /LENGTH=266 /DNA_ID=CAMNT_0007319021 /DNA_START=1 /DNA_END=801 /DNA_ORIENTATION=-